MKKLLLFFVTFISVQLFAQGSYEEFFVRILPLGTHTEITAGEYFDGCAWIFYPYGGPYELDRIRYCKIKINSDGTKEVIPDDLTGDNYYEFPFHVDDSRTGICAKTYNGMLYLFWTDNDNYIKYTRTDGEDWSDPKFADDITAGGKNMAAAVMNGYLFLLKQNVDGGVKLFRFNDEDETWKSKEIIYENSDNIGDVSLGLTSFIHEEAEHLLIAINRWNSSIETMCWDNDAGIYNDTWIQDGALGRGVALVTGRVAYDGDRQLLPAQCIIKGTDGKWWITHYEPYNNDWLDLQQIPDMPNRYYCDIPSAFSNFRFKNDGTVIKQIWVSSYVRDIALQNDMLGIYSVKSEELRLNEDETVVSTCDDAPELWSLIGVVEGPPPYVLNGSNFSDLDDPPTVFTYGTQSSSEIVNSSEWKISTSTSMNVPLLDGILSCGIDMGMALQDFNSTTYTTSYTVSKSVESGDYSLGYYYFEKPTITRYKYESYTPSGINTGEYQYIFTVTGSSLHTETFPLTRFDPSDITTFVGKEPSQSYTRLSEKGFQWSVQSPWESEFSISESTEESGSSTLSIGGNVGIADIFNVGANYETTISESHTTQFGESITVTLDCPNPRSGNTQDIKSYSGVAYWLKASNGNAYWIPDDFMEHDFTDQRPWCVTWSVGNISYNDLTDNENDNELPVEYELNQNYPNPFNPSTTIRYAIPDVGDAYHASRNVSLKIYDILGNEVVTLVNKQQSPGYYERTWNSSNLSSGIYFYVLRAGKYVESRKMILLK